MFLSKHMKRRSILAEALSAAKAVIGALSLNLSKEYNEGRCEISV